VQPMPAVRRGLRQGIGGQGGAPSALRSLIGGMEGRIFEESSAMKVNE